MSPRPVSSADLEVLLAELRTSVCSTDEGVFGPGSISWKLNRESALFLAAGRAALLQLAHPWVAAAIAQHSRTLNDPIGRFHQTFRVIFAMIFGPADQAFAVARKLHRLHQGIRGILPESAGSFSSGTIYEANEVEALRWVYATLVDSALLAYELMLPPLSHLEREKYLSESLRMAALFGISSEFLPQNWDDFREYFSSTLRSGSLGVSASTRVLAQKLQSGAGLLIKPPFWYEALTTQLLPPRLRDEFGLPYGTREEDAVRRALAWLRPLYRKLPGTIRFVGPYNEARHRLRGAKPGLAVRLSNRLWIGQPKLLATPHK